ncbi:MAG: DNA-formamidopyrimidine glycosylase family protein, partial [Acidimicrobiia bacterium]
MPELPEVESTRRHLLEALEGHRIDGVEVARARMLRRQPRSRDFADRSVGRRVVALDRRGKFMLWRLDGDLTTVVHLGMSGRIRLADPTEPRDAHTNVVWSVGGREVRLVDPRTFGFVACFTPEELDLALAGVGADALTGLPDTATLADLLADR